MSTIIHNILKEYHSNTEFFNKFRSILTSKIPETQSQAKLIELTNNFYDQYKKLPTLKELALQIKDIPGQEFRQQLVDDIKEIAASENTTKQFIEDQALNYVKDRLFTEGLMIGAEFINSKNEDKKIQAKSLIEDSLAISLDQDTGLNYDDISKRVEYYQTNKTGLKFNDFPELTKRLGDGVLPGTLSVVMAPAGVGKSLFMTACISDLIKQGKNILLVSMEMSSFEIVKRVDANVLDLPINDLKNIPKEVIYNNFEKVRNQLGKFYTKEFAPGSFSSSMLRSLLEMYKNQENVEFDAVFLDYLGIMKSDRVSMSAGLYNYVKSIGEEVRAVAVDYGISIFSASQLNRGAVNNMDADNSMISDSMGTAMTSDFIAFILQTSEMKEKSQVMIKITKNRFTGNTNYFNMNVDYSRMKFSDVIDLDSAQSQQLLNDYAKDINSVSANSNNETFNEWNFN